MRMIKFHGKYEISYDATFEENEERTIEKMQTDSAEIPEILKDVLEEVFDGVFTVKEVCRATKEI